MFKKFSTFISQTKVQFWLIFLVIILIRFFPFWFLGKTLVFGDNYSLMVPGKLFTAQWLKQGILPLWNPQVFSGIPWLADINQSVLHPSTLLFMIFQPGWALNILIVTHLFIAYAGMYLLAKKWQLKAPYTLIAAVLWMLSTQVTGSINNFSTLQSIVWLPLIGYLGLRVFRERKARWLFAVVVLLQFLGGYPQHVLYSVFLAVLLSWWKDIIQVENGWKNFWRWLLIWSETAVWTIGLSAIAWLPFMEMLLHSTRMLQSEEQALVGSLNPVMLIKLVIPYFWDNPRAGMKWGPAWNGQPNVAFYLTWLGVIVLAQNFWQLLKNWKQKKFAEDKFFAVIVISTLIFSLGEFLPGFSIVQKLIPLFRIARYPSMVMIVTNIVLILWFAKSLASWKPKKKVLKNLLALGGMATVVTLVGLAITKYWFFELWQTIDCFASYSLSHSPFHTLERDRIILFEILKSGLIISLIFDGMIAVYWRLITQRKQEARQRFWQLVLVLLVALEIGFATHGQFFFAPRDIYNQEYKNDFTELTKLDNQNFRALTRNLNVPYTDYGSYWEALVVRAPFSDSFVDQVELQTYAHVKNLRDGLTPNWNMVYGVPMVHGYTTLLPQEYEAFWSTSDQVGINFINSATPADEKFDQWSVKYYLVDNWFKLKEGENFAEFNQLAEYDRWTLYERPKALPKFRTKADGVLEVTILNEDPNSLRASVFSRENGQTMIIANRFDKDWQINVNGEKRILKNIEGMWAVDLEEGENLIELSYRPKLVYVGLGATILVAGAMVVWGLAAQQTDRKKTKK